MFEFFGDVVQVYRVGLFEEAWIKYICRYCGRVFLKITTVVKFCLKGQKHSQEKDCDLKDFFHIFIVSDWNGTLKMIAEELKKCYWLVENQIFAGPYPYNPGGKQPLLFLDNLFELGIDSFVDLTEEDELTHYCKLLDTHPGINYARFPIEDYSIPSIDQMRQILAHIKSELEQSRKIYLHCFGGVGRTGTVAGCFLAENGFEGTLAIRELQNRFAASVSSKWNQSPETDAQIAFVTAWRGFHSA